MPLKGVADLKWRYSFKSRNVIDLEVNQTLLEAQKAASLQANLTKFQLRESDGVRRKIPKDCLIVSIQNLDGKFIRDMRRSVN